MDRSIFNQLEKALGVDRVKQNFTLAPYTTFKMGGQVEYYFEAESREDIINAVKAAHTLHLPLTILGGVSNVIISEKGVAGLVVRNRYTKKEIVSSRENNVLVNVSSGYTMGRLVKELAADGLSGLEMHLGLPGTVGGAVYMNSKWTNPKVYVGDVVYSADIIDRSGRVKTVDSSYFKFRYGHSKLQETGEVLLDVIFNLKKDDSKKIITRSNEALAYRKKTQPVGVASSGCFFKNIDGLSAGAFIDKLGLKGFTVGGLTVSPIHANFIINNGNGTDKDFKQIVEKIKQAAREKYHIELKEEVVFIQ